jgi:DNA invertase Pin-like site-specific DNA recombinase
MRSTQAKWVAYTRVSTQRQGRSQLGIEGQKHAIAEHIRAHGGVCVGEFTEVESGRNNDRPELQRALAACRMHGARLLIAKLDRLARRASFLLSLRDSGIDFVACDLEGANRLTVGILAMVAETEAEAISARTKAALAAARRRGITLGNADNFTDAGRRKGREAARSALRANARQRASDRLAHINDLRAAGYSTPADIARGLSERGVPTPRGRTEWQAIQVVRLLSRLAS